MHIDSKGIQESIINYKGHGMIEKATTSNSIGHVIAHENRHLQEFRNKAMYQGKEIVSENITVKYGFQNGKIVAVAGEATAMMRDKSLDNPTKPEKSGVENKSVQPTIEKPGEDEGIRRKLDLFLARIDSALSKLDSKLGNAENDNLQIQDENLTRIVQKRVELEAKKKEIQNKKNKLDADKLNELTEQLLESLSQLAEQASNVMKAIYGLKSGKQSEQNPDNNNELDVPDYSMLYTGMLLDTMIH